MNLVLSFDYDSDIIDVPAEVVANKDELQIKFLEWLCDENNRHRYWVSFDRKHDGSQYGVCYRSDAFIEWLNNYSICQINKKARLIKDHVRKFNNKLPVLNF